MLTLHARVTPADQAADPYFYLPFDVPAGTTRIDVTLAYPKAPDCIIDLGCLDPRIDRLAVARGLPRLERRRPRPLLRRHRRRHARLRPRPHPAGPLAGHPRPLQAPARRHRGHRHRRPRRRRPSRPRRSPSAPSRSAPVPAGTAAISTATPSTPTPAARPSSCTPPPGRPASTSSPSPTTTPPPSAATSTRPPPPTFVFLRGMEVTTAAGHANVYGVDAWIDFRMTRPSDAHALARLVHDAGRPALDQPRQADDPLGLRVPRRRLHGGLAVRLAGLELDLARPLAGPPRRRPPPHRHRRQRLPPARPAPPGRAARARPPHDRASTSPNSPRTPSSPR